MSSREKILAAVKANQPDSTILPDLSIFTTTEQGSLEKFAEVLGAIGGKIVRVSSYNEIAQIISLQYSNGEKIVSPLKEFKELITENLDDLLSIHDLHDVDLAILKAYFGVAENGAVWITENEMARRVLPFVTQRLAVVIDEANIVPKMHQAYDKISAMGNYGFGAFIAGPSKTADIEQSLVIGAHGPRSMTVFVLNANFDTTK
jgi:L-lactate dehydrogenase complex protein LldG